MSFSQFLKSKQFYWIISVQIYSNGSVILLFNGCLCRPAQKKKKKHFYQIVFLTNNTKIYAIRHHAFIPDDCSTRL